MSAPVSPVDGAPASQQLPGACGLLSAVTEVAVAATPTRTADGAAALPGIQPAGRCVAAAEQPQSPAAAEQP